MKEPYENFPVYRRVTFHDRKPVGHREPYDEYDGQRASLILKDEKVCRLRFSDGRELWVQPEEITWP